MSIEIENLKEEIKEITSRCINCGMCNGVCPVLRILRKEWNSPRGLCILLNQDIFEKVLYDCTLCKACEDNCPLKLNLCDTFIKARNVLVKKGKENENVKEITKKFEIQNA